MATTVTLKPNAIDISGSTSGTTTLQATAVAGTTVLTLPAATDTLVGKATTDTLTNKTLVAPALGTPASGVVTNLTGTASININGTVGATTPTTGAFTSITASTTLTATGAGSIQGLTVGRGAGAQGTNTAVGASALAANSTGGNNTAIGYQSGQANNGDNNTFIGRQAGTANTSGSANTALGSIALFVNTTGSNNTAIGQEALRLNTTASNNTAVGYQAAYSANSPSSIIAIGYQAGYTGILRGLTIGAQAGYSATGDDNICIGYQAGYYTTATTTGTSNIFLGQYCRGSGATVTGEIVVGYNLAGKGASTTFIGGTSGAYNGANTTTWSTTSDQRLKKNIVDNTDGLSKITQIRVRNFEYRLPEEVTELDANCAIAKTGVQLGVIAQELQAVLPECVKTESTGVMTVDADNLTWYLVNAVKELSAQVAQLQSQLKGN